MPMPKPVAFSSRPSAFEYSALPSASIRTLSPTFDALPQAFITNTSLTAMQAMVSMPLALSASACCRNPGRCFASQVGVNAPGTEKSTTFLPLKSCSVLIFCGPSLVMCVSTPAGILSPTLMVMSGPSRRKSGSGGHRAARESRRGAQPGVEREQQRLGRGPVDTGVGHRYAVFELHAIGRDRLSAPAEIAFEHQADDRTIALEELVADVLRD